MNSAGAPHIQQAGPFGYSFFQHDSSSIPDADPTATTTTAASASTCSSSVAAATTSTAAPPTPGPSLLNHQEEDYINTFFMAHAGQEMTSNSFDIAIQQASDQLQGTAMTQFGWLMTEQPPNFITASATPKQTSHHLGPYQHMAHHASLDFGNGHHQHHQHPLHTQHFMDSNDMLSGGAAVANDSNNNANIHQSMLAQGSMLQQHGGMGGPAHMQPPQQTPSLVSGPSTEASDMMHPTDALQGLPVSSASLMAGGAVIPPTTILPHELRDILSANPLTAHALGNTLSGLAPLDTVLHDVHYDGPHTAPARLDEAADARLFRFGSDSHFGLDGFKPSSNSERHEFIAQRLTEELHMLKPINRSNNPTRASSPVGGGPAVGHARKRSSAHLDGPGGMRTDDDTGHPGRPKKRRKDSADDDVGGDCDGDDDQAGGGAAPGRRKLPMSGNLRMRRVSSAASAADDPNGSGHVSASPSKRRRSSGPGAGGKPPRENLTEEQKRNNHIHSEQKRRNLIKRGFDELRRLVPELRAGGLSKSMELVEVSNFLEQLVGANKELRRRMGIVKPG
ncbi:hypothetical protein, variant [Verruconis gallopava]|uniref:BHLH domain-containing protein n=1 Tax=Verruconis gallopava TaxID=253628 RepID=A0A0D1YZU4_9PEZI|nr:uncharacterized protein PV09_02708 [Verruconis gallopava]XP_016216102.1 hypothetical protein, variant [Verruconis gallopava]KIW06232.1 hypothetical protein PV09_02708 [Verruconis gallopava]KIW06233.1 hypothetical protein, variant [Verruconis gallopava]